MGREGRLGGSSPLSTRLSKLGIPPCHCLGRPLHDTQAQPSLPPPPPPPLCLLLLTVKGTLSRPGSASGRIWSGPERQPSSGSGPEHVGDGEEGLTKLPALKGVLRSLWGNGAAAKVSGPVTTTSDQRQHLSPGGRQAGGHAGLPGRKLWCQQPQDNAGYRAAKERLLRSVTGGPRMERG